MSKPGMQFARKLTLMALAAGCFLSSPIARATVGWNAGLASQAPSNLSKQCPPRDGVDAALGNASTLMSQARNQDAAALLEPLAGMNCDARADLLLAAAFEGQGDEHRVIEVLEHAHSAWPSNNSIAASLARAYLAGGQKDQAVKSLAHFQGTAETPEQELEMAVVVYLAADHLISAQKIAEEDYKYHPSVHSLLLLANTLQMQGRYPDVNRLLGSKRSQYINSPEFLITLAESELDASIYVPARQDLQSSISLNPNLYQAHYLLGNVLSRTGDPDGAITEYRLAIKLAPEQPRTYYQLALVLRTKQDDAGEQHALEQALAIDDRYTPAHCEMGKILLEDHRPADAVSHLLAAIQYNPRYEEAYFLLARAYGVLGQQDKSKQMVQALKTVRAENRSAMNNKSEASSTPAPSTRQ